MLPHVPIPPDAQFVLRREHGQAASVRLLFAEGRGAGTVLLWIAFFFAFMVLVTNSAWSPILLRIEGMPIERSAVALAAFNFGSLFGSAAAGWLVARLGRRACCRSPWPAVRPHTRWSDTPSRRLPA